MLIAKILVLAAALYAVALALIAANERSFIYFPDRRRIPPESLSLARIFERTIRTSDGAEVVAWYAPAAEGKPTVLYFHGNAGGLITRASRFPQFEAEGIGLFMTSYRSYSGSTGKPSEKAIVEDAMLAWDMLIAEGVDPGRIFIYGESLGTGVAIQLAALRAPRALILEAPYTSLVDIGSWRLPFVPVGRLMRDRFESESHIKRVHVPLLVLHGERDGVVPCRFGRQLFAAANEPKRFVAYPRGGHSDLYTYGAFADLAGFIRSLTA